MKILHFPQKSVMSNHTTITTTDTRAQLANFSGAMHGLEQKLGQTNVMKMTQAILYNLQQSNAAT